MGGWGDGEEEGMWEGRERGSEYIFLNKSPTVSCESTTHFVS